MCSCQCHFISEDVKTWLSNQDVHFACLQETHLTPGKMQEAMVSLSTLGYQTWGEPAALTDGGTSGGLMCAAKKHINFRLHSSFTVEGKGCQILIGRFRRTGCCHRQYLPSIWDRSHQPT